MTNVLVLGAAGFNGGHIAKKAQDGGWKVHGFRRNSSSGAPVQSQDIVWVEGDLDHFSSLKEAMSGMDYVFHAAGYYPTDYDPRKISQQISFAAEQMKNVVRATREAGVKRLIYTSTMSTIGLPPENESRLADERDFYRPGSLPHNGYYEAKCAMENIALEASRGGYGIVVLNPTTVFGPGDVHISTGKILLMIAEGKARAIPPGTINIIDVRDAAAAHINAARIAKAGERYILGGANYSISEAAAINADIAGTKPPSLTLPTWVLDLYIRLADSLPFVPYAPFHLRAYRHWQGYNMDKAKRELKLQSRFLEETVRDSLRWFSQHQTL